jgi:hypothetical protein
MGYVFFFLTLLFRILRLRPVKMVAEEAQIITTLRILKNIIITFKHKLYNI